MQDFYPFSFDAAISTYDVGSKRYVYTVLWLPEALHDRLPLDAHPRLRVEGEMNEVPFESALMPVPGSAAPGGESTSERRWYLLLSDRRLRAMAKAVDREAPLRDGDTVQVMFRIAEQNAVDLPPALAMALAQNQAMQARWDELTPGRQRGLSHRVATAKRPDTQQRRVNEVFEIMTGVRDARGKRIA